MSTCQHVNMSNFGNSLQFLESFGDCWRLLSNFFSSISFEPQVYVAAQAKSIEELPESPPESPSSDTPKLLGSFSYPDPYLSQKIDVKSNDFLPGRFVTIVSRDPKYPIILSEVRVYGREVIHKPSKTYPAKDFTVKSIYIKTGDNEYADSDAKLRMEICDGEEPKNCCLTNYFESWKDNLERGQIDIFTEPYYFVDDLGYCKGTLVRSLYF